MNINKHQLACHFGWLLFLLFSACSTYKDGGILYNGYRYSKVTWLFDTARLYTIDPSGLNIPTGKFPGELKKAHEAAWSPDGQWVAYSIGGGAAGEPGSDIYITDRDGENTFKITSDLGNDSNPAWSPDGKQILYDTFWKGADYLAVQDVSCILDNVTCNLKRELLTEGRSPDWSPDGSSIVYQWVSDSSIIYQISVDKPTRPLALTPKVLDCWAPKWSPDGTKIAVDCWQGNSFIYIVNKYGTNLTNLGVEGIRPEWSSDGRKIYFLSSEGENLGKMLGWETCYTNALFMLDLESKKVSRLTSKENECIWWYTLLPELNR